MLVFLIVYGIGQFRNRILGSEQQRQSRMCKHVPISQFDMSCTQAHWVRSKPICRVMQLKLHKPTMAIGYSLRMCARHVNSTNPGRSNLVFRSKPIPEAEM